jgi:hypothetical protein
MAKLTSIADEAHRVSGCTATATGTRRSDTRDARDCEAGACARSNGGVPTFLEWTTEPRS